MEQINATSLKRKFYYSSIIQYYSTVFFIWRIALCQFPPWQIAVPRQLPLTRISL